VIAGGEWGACVGGTAVTSVVGELILQANSELAWIASARQITVRVCLQFIPFSFAYNLILSSLSNCAQVYAEIDLRSKVVKERWSMPKKLLLALAIL
jgi:hypothetical protein